MTDAPSFSSNDKTSTVNTALSIHDNGYSAVLTCAEFLYLFLTVAWSDASHTDGTLTLEMSNDGVNNWETHTAAYTIGSAAGAHHWNVALQAIPYVRLKVAKGSNTAGVCNVYARMEVPVR